MERFKSITIIFLLTSGLLTSIALAKPAGVLLQEGIYAEEIEGNLNAAIKIYEQIVKDDSAERTHVAQALYRLGLCHLKKQNEQQAKAVFEKLVTAFFVLLSIIALAVAFADSVILLAVVSDDLTIPFAIFSPDSSADFTMPSAIILASETVILSVWV